MFTEESKYAARLMELALALGRVPIDDRSRARSLALAETVVDSECADRFVELFEAAVDLPGAVGLLSRLYDRLLSAELGRRLDASSVVRIVPELPLGGEDVGDRISPAYTLRTPTHVFDMTLLDFEPRLEMVEFVRMAHSPARWLSGRVKDAIDSLRSAETTEPTWRMLRTPAKVTVGREAYEYRSFAQFRVSVAAGSPDGPKIAAYDRYGSAVPTREHNQDSSDLSVVVG